MARDERTADGKDSLLNRRTLIKTTGIGLAGLAGLAASGQGAAASYRTVTVPAGGHRSFSVGDGETLENLLVDITASGATCSFNATANNWTMRNIGVRGKQSSDGTLVTISVPDSGSTGTLENCYFGDGQEYQSSTDAQAVGIWVDATGSNAHLGTLQLNNVHLGGFINNGLYASGTAVQQGSSAGDTVLDGCYFRSNNIAQVRISHTGDIVRNSVIIAREDEVVAEGPDDGGRVKNGRGIWGHDGWGEVQVENCDIYSDWGALVTDSQTGMVATDCRVHGGISADVDTQNVTGSPDLTPPAGAPMTAVEAASGSSSTSSTSDSTTTTTADDLPNTISISGGSSSNIVSYSFTVSDALEKSTAGGASIDDGDTITGTTANGAIAGGTDSYAYAGDITAFTVDDGATVTVNGETVDPATLGDSSTTNTITLTGNSGRSDYSFTVSDSVTKSSEGDATINGGDHIDGSMVTGAVAGGVDAYDFTGTLTAFSLDGDATVTLNGETVDPAVLADSAGSDLSNTVSITGGSASNIVSYSFTVSDALAKSTAGGASIDDGDTITGTTANGTIAGGTDSYVYAGDITAFTVDDGATVTVNGETVDPASF